MKNGLCIGLVALASCLAKADDFDAQLTKIRGQSGRIQSQLRGLGIKEEAEEVTSIFAGGDRRKTRPMFEVHGDAKFLVAESGKFAFGRLANRLVVSAEPHPVIVALDDGQGPFSGLRIKGNARQGSNPDRIQIDLVKLVLTDGRTLQVVAQVLDKRGASGLQADVFSAKAWAEAGALAGSFVSGLASAYQTQATNGLGFTSVQPTGRNALLQGVAQTAADGSKRLLEEATREKPVLVVEAGTEVTVFFDEEVRL